ncbi:hypothetical protein AaE_003882, partial [Aphanomyces astaci]
FNVGFALFYLTLEVLATAEETAIRDKAVASINKVLDVVTDAAELALLLIKRLTEGDWFTSRVSARWIFPVAYSKVDPANKKELREYVPFRWGINVPIQGATQVKCTILVHQ